MGMCGGWWCGWCGPSLLLKRKKSPTNHISNKAVEVYVPAEHRLSFYFFMFPNCIGMITKERDRDRERYAY